MNFSPISLLVLTVSAVVIFVAGRMSVSQSDEEFADGSEISANESGYGFASGSTSGDSRRGRTSSVEGSRKFVLSKSTTELRDELEKLQKLHGTARTRGLEQIQDRLSASEIANFVQEMVEGPLSPRDIIGLNILISAFAEKDPEAAWKLALIVPSGSGRYGNPRYIVISEWAHTDPTAALQALEEIPEGNARAVMLCNVFRAWAKTDYNAALKYVMESSAPSVLSNGLITIAGVMGGDKASLLKTILEKVPSGSKMQRAIDSLMESWASEDPRAAAVAVGKLPLINSTRSAVAQVAVRWLEFASDKNEPLQWVLSMSDRRCRQEALGRLFSNWVETDPSAATTAAMKLPDEDRTSTLSALVVFWAHNSPEAAVEWASSLTDPQQRQTVLNSLLTNLGHNDPQKGIAIANSLGLSNDASIMGNFVSQWVYNDVSAASAWVRKLPDGEIRDISLKTMASYLYSNDCKNAITWAIAISDPEMRLDTIENVLRQWKRLDTTEAHDWITSSNLSKENKNHLLQKMKGF